MSATSHFGPLLQVMQHNFGIIAQSRGLRLTAMDSHYTIRSDEALLRRILQNLLSNAIRYTPKGRVLIGCRRQGEQLRIEVHDQGPAFPKACSVKSSRNFAAWAKAMISRFL